MVVFDGHEYLTEEERRLKEDRDRVKYWKKWGPYVAERQWATGKFRDRPFLRSSFANKSSVREDYSPDGDAWSRTSATIPPTHRCLTIPQISRTSMRAPELSDGVKMVSLVSLTLMDTRTSPSVFGTKKSTDPNRLESCHRNWRQTADPAQCLPQGAPIWSLQPPGKPRRERERSSFPC